MATIETLSREQEKINLMIGGITFSNEKVHKKQALLRAEGLDFVKYYAAEAYYDMRNIRDFWRKEMRNEEAAQRTQRYMDSLIEENQRLLEPDWDDIREIQQEQDAIAADRGAFYHD